MGSKVLSFVCPNCVQKDAEIERLRAIIERIQTQHWDMAACPCWICRAAREAGCRPREAYLRDPCGMVRVEGQ